MGDDDFVVVDATECPIARSTLSWFQTSTRSRYKKKNTVKYEVAMSEDGGTPISFSGPFVGPEADITIFRAHLKKIMEERGWIGLADGTYQGEDAFLEVPPRPFHSLDGERREKCRAQSTRRMIVENLIARLKSFIILSVPFRHAVVKHVDVFRVILQSVAVDLQVRPFRRRR